MAIKFLYSISFFLIANVLYGQTFEVSSGLDVIVFPAEEQDAEQQEFDEFKCYKWAVNQTKFDPVSHVDDSKGGKELEPDGSVIKGAAGGAIFGALIGAISGDAGKGAKIGAVAGGVSGLASKSARDAATREAIKRQEQTNKEGMDKFKRAFCTCLDAKGYKARY